MLKKLLSSFLLFAIIIIFSTHPAYAYGPSLSSPSNSLDLLSFNGLTYDEIDLDNSTTTNNLSKLQRKDSLLVYVEGASDAELSSSDDVQTIYSPDLPDSNPGKYLCDDVNSYIALEIEMINMVNEARLAAGQSELIYCDELSYFARLHSADMADKHYFSHTSQSNGNYVTRLFDSGINYISSGENLARFADLDRAHKALLSSYGHRLNMLSPKYTHVGIGIVWDEKLEVYCITQWFARFY